MKKLIIQQIAKQYRSRVTKAKTVQAHHLAHMYGWTYNQLIKTYLKTLIL